MAGYIGSKAVSVNTTSATISDDLAVGDDLTVTDDATIGGTLGVTGVLTATSLDISGDIDVDGTTNLDIVDIDGAVNMATTALVTGVLTTTAATVFNGGFTANDGSIITTADNTTQLSLISTDTDANTGPVFVLWRNSANSADGDNTGKIAFQGEDDAGNKTTYSTIDTFISDNTNGTEDGQLALKTVVAGTERHRINMESAETVINDDSVDLDFRVESNGNANMLFVDGGENRIGIGTNAPATDVHIQKSSATAILRLHRTGATNAANAALGQLEFFNADGTGDGPNVTSKIVGSTFTSTGAGGNLEFYTHDSSESGGEGSEPVQRVKIDGAGNFLVGGTDTNPTGNHVPGALINANGQGHFQRDGGNPLRVGTSAVTGNFTEYYREGALMGQIGTRGATVFDIGSGDVGFEFHGADNAIFPTDPVNHALRDNAIALGSSSYRYDDAFVTNGVTTGSDRTEKQDIAVLTSSEILVAARISQTFHTYRWKDAVVDKGDNARIHTGTIAQEVQAAFTAEGLDVGRYAMFMSDTWWEHDVEEPAIEANEEVEARAAFTRTNTYKTEDEAPEGSTSRTRLGIRYPELLSFLAAYNEQRFAAIETRLTALEG